MQPWVKNVIIFAMGLLVGCAGTGFYIHHCFSRAWTNSGNHHHVVEVLKQELELTSAETAQVEKIFDDASPAMEALRLETNKKLKMVRDNTMANVRKTLSPDQQKKLDTLKVKWDAKLNTNDKGWHIPGLPPGPPPSGSCSVACSPSPDGPVSK
jgi:Spy/CpxP family protein refolding chaperone